jgi:pyruvate/2-oxoglutarate dehydrogenase complex dihydrolipoamide acyltransferase (E2) component
MGPDDASFADMRRPFTDPDPLALDEETVERLLAGDLPPSQAPPGYGQVAALLAATAAEPTPEELAGQAEVLAELRAVTWTPRRAAAHTRRAARPPRRRWAGLAAAALVGTLVTGGAAVAATGNLPGPVQNVARSILGTLGGAPEPATPTQPDPQPAAAPSNPASASTTAGPKGPRPAGSTTPGSGPIGAGPVGEAEKEGLCKAFLASQDKENGKKMAAAAIERLAEAAGGKSAIPAYCDGTQPGGPKKDEKQPPPGGPGQGQGGSPPDTGGGQGQAPSTRSSNR